MLLWIVVYSFFESFDFAHEVGRLFGGVTFWVTVVLAVAIALRESTKLSSFAYSSLDPLVPRVLVKFVSTSFAPQDIDTIRYMWVKGNLKDRLGIRVRRGQKAPVNGSSSGLEGTPMFIETHARSPSEVSIYEPGQQSGSGYRTPPTQTEKLTGTSLQINAAVVASSGSSHHTFAPIATTSEDEDMPVAISATEAGVSVATPHSPQPSYYSASDLPLPSPLSSRIPTPSQAHPRMASISYSRPIRGQYLSPLLDHVHSPPNSTETRPHDRKLNEGSPPPGLSPRSEAYELSAMGKHGSQRRSRSSSPAWPTSTLLTTDEPTAL